MTAGAKSAAAKAASTANNPSSSSAYSSSSMYGGSGYGSSDAETRQPLNQADYGRSGGSKGTNYRGMNLDADEDAHSVPQSDLLGIEQAGSKSSFSGFGDEQPGNLQPLLLTASVVHVLP